jgi:hypothetical protein
MLSRRAQNVVPRMEKKFVLYCLKARSVAFHCSAKKANNGFFESKVPVPINISKLSTASVRARRCASRSLGLWAASMNWKASGRLEALIRSGLRHCEKFALIDAHAAGETQAVTVQRIGPDLVFGRLWKECGIQEVIQSLLQARHYDFDALAGHLPHRVASAFCQWQRSSRRTLERKLPHTGNRSPGPPSPLPSHGILRSGNRTQGPKDPGYTALPEGFN